ncbi:MAG: tRNA (adenosine(37)-N6)-dimethylallyltransferase MiaA [Chlamydiae bacterium]|nr:tRNA (adenosine(37)-N6)-dimethylallyltransferase MiaA [Chlamydiota bacterium]
MNSQADALLDQIYLPLRQKNIVVGKKNRIVVIAGPTGVGKTALAIEIAKIINGEIVSADSMQVYKGMDVGTAKASKEQINQVPHHLIDIKEINELFNVCDFYNEAHKAIRSILAKGKVPIVVGGSGFYIHVLLYGPPMGPPCNIEIRNQLEQQLNQMGPDVMYEQLQMLDPDYAKTISEKDKHKIIRALEIIALTKKKVSDIPKPQKVEDLFDFRCWFIYKPKEILYPLIEIRCDEMINKGFIEEVVELEKKGIRQNSSASQAIGYRQCLNFLTTDRSRDQKEHFVHEFKKASRHFVKRQFTWFRKEPLFRWLNVDEINQERVIEFILQDYEQGI